MVSNDRREFQRLRLGKPILGLLDGQNALILDIGVSGAYVEHYGEPAVGDTMTLLFRWKGEDVVFVCEVMHTEVMRRTGNSVVSNSGMHFIDAASQSEARLNDLVATFVGKILAAQKANASASDTPDSAALVDLGGARRSRSRGYLTFQLSDGAWSREWTTSPAQPENGFTVAGYEDDEELETLCRTYATADEEGRRLIQLVAELSARTVKR